MLTSARVSYEAKLVAFGRLHFGRRLKLVASAGAYFASLYSTSLYFTLLCCSTLALLIQSVGWGHKLALLCV